MTGAGHADKAAVDKMVQILLPMAHPGLANTGFGVVDFCNGRYRMVSYGCITTGSEEPHGQRLLTIYNRLCAVIDEFQPTEAGMETLYFAKNAKSATRFIPSANNSSISFFKDVG